MVVNPERGAVEVQSEDGKKTYVFRLRHAALAKLQRNVSPAHQLIPLDEVLQKLGLVLLGKSEDMDFFLHVLLAALQEFHSDTIRTTFDVDDVIQDVGGLDKLAEKLRALQDSVTPDPEDVKRRAGNPRRARTRS